MVRMIKFGQACQSRQINFIHLNFLLRSLKNFFLGFFHKCYQIEILQYLILLNIDFIHFRPLLKFQIPCHLESNLNIQKIYSFEYLSVLVFLPDFTGTEW